ncbi:MAG: hypothetical protein PW845_00800 [Pseudomonas sp.]|nr:hypothetical protein [Pseudomonas sp.]
MSDPLDKATSKAPPTLGEGCLSRYDPDALGEEDGADFSAAAELLEQTQVGLEKNLGTPDPARCSFRG